MAEQIFNVNCGFFDSINQDRMYSAEDMTRPYKNIISNGVFATSKGTPSNKLQVLSADDDMNIIVKAGDGIFADKWFENPSDLNITVPANTNIVGRYDSVIVQVDKRSMSRTGNIVYREGIAASDPVPPTINDVDNIIEYRIANIYVAAGASKIGQENISDLRGSAECPWVTSLIQQVDTSTLYEQYRAAYQKYYDDETELFNAFMKTLTEELTVYTSVIKYESNFVTTEDNTTEIPINIINYSKDRDILMVKINRLFVTEEVDYTISEDGSSIILTNPLMANQDVDFLVLQSVVIADAETIMTEFEKLAEAVNIIKVDVENAKTDIDNLEASIVTQHASFGFSDQVCATQIRELEIGGVYEVSIVRNFNTSGNNKYRSVLYGILSIPCGYDLSTSQVVVRPKFDVISNYHGMYTEADSEIYCVGEGNINEIPVGEFENNPVVYILYSNSEYAQIQKVNIRKISV